MNDLPASIIGFGVALNPHSLEIEAVAFTCVERRFGAADSKQTRIQKASDNGAAKGVTALGLFLLLAHIARKRNKQGDLTILLHESGQPGSTMHDFVHTNAAWHKRLIGEKNGDSLKKQAISSTNGNILWKMRSPSCIGTFDFALLPSSANLRDFDVTQRGFSEEQIQRAIKLAAKSWPKWTIPEWALDSVQISEEDLDVDSRWTKMIDEEPFWNEVQLLGGTRAKIIDIFVKPLLDSGHIMGIPSFVSSISFASKHRRGTTDPLSLFNTLHRVQVISGEPGSGKSTLVKWIAIRSAHADNGVKIPYVVILRSFASELRRDPALTILKYFVAQLYDTSIAANREFALIEDSERQEEHLLPVVILDGWDEVPADQRADVLREIRRVSKRWKLIITSRPFAVGLLDLESAPKILTLSKLPAEAIRSLVSKFFTSKNRQSLIPLVVEHIAETPSLRELSESPFILTNICQLALQDFERFSAVSSASAVLVGLIESALGAANKRTPDEFPHVLGLKSLEELAFQLSFGDTGKKLTFELHEIDAHLGERYRNQIIQSGLVVSGDLSARTFSLVHPRVQEYLAARRLLRSDKETFVELLSLMGESHGHVEEWRFVFSLAKGYPDNAEALLNYWRSKIESPDIYGGIICIAAELLSEWEPGDGGKQLLGVDLREILISNAESGIWPERSATALGKLDYNFLLDRLRSLLPDELPLYSELTYLARRVLPDIWTVIPGLAPFIGKAGEECLMPPPHLDEIRTQLRNPEGDPNERGAALVALWGYRDDETMKDVMDILFSISSFPRSGEKKLLMDAIALFLEVVSQETAASVFLIVLAESLKVPTEAEVRGEGGFHKADYLFSALVDGGDTPLIQLGFEMLITYILQCDDEETRIYMLKCAGYCDLGELGLRLYRGLEDKTPPVVLAKIFRSTPNETIFNELIPAILTDPDPENRTSGFESLAEMHLSVGGNFALLLDRLSDPGISTNERCSVFGLLSGGPLSRVQRSALSQWVGDALLSVTNFLGEEGSDQLLIKVIKKCDCYLAAVRAEVINYCLFLLCHSDCDEDVLKVAIEIGFSRFDNSQINSLRDTLEKDVKYLPEDGKLEQSFTGFVVKCMMNLDWVRALDALIGISQRIDEYVYAEVAVASEREGVLVYDPRLANLRGVPVKNDTAASRMLDMLIIYKD